MTEKKNKPADAVVMALALRHRERARLFEPRLVRRHKGAVEVGGRGPRPRHNPGRTEGAQGGRADGDSADSPRNRAAGYADELWRFKKKTFASWDSFILPYPFSRGVFICGEPVTIAKDAGPEEMERVRAGLEGTLNELTRRADGFFS